MVDDSEVQQNLSSLLETRTAGDPDEEDVVFTDLSPATLSKRLAMMGTPACDQTIRDWLDDCDIRLRKIRKDIPGGTHPDRDAQFKNIADLIEQYQADGNPWFSFDTKAKEHLGYLFRKGRSRSTSPQLSFDHDFPSWATGVLIPHGIYDHLHLRGHVNIGLSHDTSEFACDSLARACTGMLFDKLETAVTLMRKASTATGLTTTVHVIKRAYATGRNATDEIKQNLKIVYDALLPSWNYRAVPEIRQ